jgi:ABC-type branched-subunit amino acid transport system substrate-binding protein
VTRNRSALALLAVTVLMGTTACGSRVDTTLRQAAADQALGRNGGGGTGGLTTGGTTGATTGTTTGASTGTTTGAATGTTTGTTGTTGATPGGSTGAVTSGGGTTGATTGTTGATGGSAGAPAPAGGNGGATDVGVTPNALSVGVIADLAGPVPGLFEGAVSGTQAYLAKVNSEGGVYGRQIKLDVNDSQMDCGQYQAATSRVVGRDFAMVGSFSLYDGCGVSALKGSPTFSDVHSALQNGAQGYANNFSVAPLEQGWRLGPLQYMQKRFGERFKHIGGVYASVGGGAETWAHCKAAINHVGGGVAYDRAFGATETDYTADIVRMKNAGVQMIYMPATNAGVAADVLKAARAQNVDWPIVYGGPAYDKAFLDKAGAQAEGVFEDQQYALFFNASDAATIPAVADYQKWMKLTGNSSKMDLFSAYGWSSAQLFVQALKAAGPQAKRTTLLAELRKVNTFDAGGLLASADPAGKHAARCWLFTTVSKGQWTRVDSPASTFRCDGGYFLG